MFLIVLEEAGVTPKAMAEFAANARSRADEVVARGSGQVGSGQKADILSWLIITGN